MAGRTCSARENGLHPCFGFIRCHLVKTVTGHDTRRPLCVLAYDAHFPTPIDWLEGCERHVRGVPHGGQV